MEGKRAVIVLVQPPNPVLSDPTTRWPLGLAYLEAVLLKAVDWSKYRGHIIGETTIVGEVTMEDIGMKVTHSPWFFGEFGFVVKDGILYDIPIPCRGQLGLFEVNLEGLPE